MPLFFIVPNDCDEICYCERVTHVRHLSRWQYENGPESKHYNQDESLLKRICGTKETNRDVSIRASSGSQKALPIPEMRITSSCGRSTSAE
jgi:hypothetical protein